MIVQGNWGRYWKCAGYENAQLQRLAFRRLDATPGAKPATDWNLSPASTLLVRPSFEPYIVLLEPGEYALSGFRMKVAASDSDVRVADVDASQLIVDGKPTGGSFDVAAGEIVYIGHFGVDCHGEPMPWRSYVKGADDFKRYVAAFRKRFPFVGERPVVFRLFAKEHFGNAYELPR